MKNIFAFIAALSFSVCFSVIGQGAADARIRALEEQNKTLRAEMREYEANIQARRRNGRRPNPTDADLMRFNRAEIERNEAKIAELKANPASATNAAPYVHAPRFIVVGTNPPSIKATNATTVTAESKDWRNAEQKAKWDAITARSNAPTKIGPPRPATKVILN